MTSTSITPTRPQRTIVASNSNTRTSAKAVDLSVEETEERRWLLMLGIPFMASACFYAATISTGVIWLLAPAMVLGPALIILSFIYLGLTSDTNGTDEAPRDS